MMIGWTRHGFACATMLVGGLARRHGREEEGEGDDEMGSRSSAGDRRSRSLGRPSRSTPGPPRKVPLATISPGPYEPPVHPATKHWVRQQQQQQSKQRDKAQQELEMFPRLLKVSRSETQVAVSARKVAKRERDLPQGHVDIIKQQAFGLFLAHATAEAAAVPATTAALARAAARGAHSPPPRAPNPPEGVCFFACKCAACMGASETIIGQLATAEGLVRFQLPMNNPNTPFGGALRHVASALEWHARVPAH